MKLNLTKSILLIASLFIAVGCGDSSSGNGNGNGKGKGNGNGNGQSQQSEQGEDENCTGLPEAVESALISEKSTLNEELANTISYMGNEERLAYDVYNRLYSEWGTNQFTNIATKSEYKHISAVQQLVQKYKKSDAINFTNIDLPELGYLNTPIEEMKAGTYDIAKIQKLYDDLISIGLTSEVDALKVGCMVEVTDVDDLDKYLKMAQDSNAKDVEEVFNFLRDGSYNHYWAFNKGLTKKGIADGCCSLGTIDGVNYCHPEYPQKEK